MAETRLLPHHRQGRGEPLVLVHGIGSRWQVWRPILDRVAERREVIALDLPGFGASRAQSDGSVSQLADRVAAFLDSLGLRRPAIAGSSLGGGVALELGRRGLAGAVTAFAPVGFFSAGQARWCRTVVGAAHGVAGRLDPLLPAVMSTRAGRRTLCGVFYARTGQLRPADCVADARALAAAPGFAAARAALGDWRLDRSAAAALDRLPVTVAWGTRDLVLPYPGQAARAREVLPHARHVRLRGCGHLPFADDPGACAGLLLTPC